MKLVLALITFVSFPALASDCIETIPLSKIESTAKSYVGQINSVKLAKDKKDNICVYRIYGENGYVVIDATNGELLRFSKRKNK